MHDERRVHGCLQANNIVLPSESSLSILETAIVSKEDDIEDVLDIGTVYWKAPEAINEKKLLPSADIWSLGITTIEILQRMPPRYNMHPMRVMFIVNKEDSPELEASKFSRYAKDFVNLCLQKDPQLRPTALELFNHPFISKGKDLSLILPDLIERSRRWKLMVGCTDSEECDSSDESADGCANDCAWDFDDEPSDEHSTTEFKKELPVEDSNKPKEMKNKEETTEPDPPLPVGKDTISQTFDFTALSGELDRKLEQLQSEVCLNSISKEGEKLLDAQSMDLLDILSRSGTVDLEYTTLHIIQGATHCWDNSIMDTILQQNENPIAPAESSCELLSGFTRI